MKHGAKVELTDFEVALFRAHGLVADAAADRNARALRKVLASQLAVPPTVKRPRGRPRNSTEKLFLIAAVKALVAAGIKVDQALHGLTLEKGSPFKGRDQGTLRRRYYETLKSFSPEYREKIARWKIEIAGFSPPEFQDVLQRIVRNAAVRKSI